MPENTSYNVDSGNESEQITRLFEVGVIVLKFDPIANMSFEKRPQGYLCSASLGFLLSGTGTLFRRT